ncbi:hypothetical protein ACFPT7_00545 [Acidicapsa dinghuensis]|uniref:MFS transporter n=1 Tax=Acidicapsa dinghuensis TaxID=2218256 RepID=A0ABW1ECR0_9BACT|nr:hypothetical protein [Acidicapsa dinghuensis]
MSTNTALAIYGVITGLLVISATLWALWLGLKRAQVNASTRLQSWSTTAAILVIWYLAFTILGARGFFATPSKPTIPVLPIAVLLGVSLGIWYALRNTTRKAVAALPAAALIAVQMYRVNGLIFLLYTVRGQLPVLFGLTAGIGDISVGLLAIVSARLLVTGHPSARRVAYLWNALGILDLTTALTIGFLSSPSPLQRFAFDHPNTLISTWPLVMIPIFVVPLSLVLHILSLWQLRQQHATTTEHLSTPAPAVSHMH